MKKSLTILVVAALSCAVFAQGGGQGRGGGRMFRMGGPGGGGSLSMLVNRSDVQKELGLDSGQKSKLEAMADRRREEMRARFEEMRNNGGGNGGPPDGEAMMKEMREREAKASKELADVLKPEQMVRLKELGIQRAGNYAIMNPDVQAQLGVTDAQKKQIDDLQGKQRAAMESVMEKARNGEIERDEIRGLMEKNSKIMGDELGKLLSQAQREKLKAMAGKPFTFEQDEERGPGR